MSKPPPERHPPTEQQQSETENAYRHLPSVHQLVERAAHEDWARQLDRSQLVVAARQVIGEGRRAIADGGLKPCTAEQMVLRLRERSSQLNRPPLPEVINATGILLHTGLGRAPLAQQALRAIEAAARGYTPLEISLEDGLRSSRGDVVRSQLQQLTGAAHSTVVNNNAAALLLALNTLAKGREVIVACGELIEIGGSFRLPEIMSASGAALVAVGTTNKTRLSDYLDAINEQTAMLLKVHPSNFHISGFTESVAIEQLAQAGHERGLPVVHDIGSGALFELSQGGFDCEPVARRSIMAGADAVLFSGDKLLGGPQAGIIVGNQRSIEAMEKNPLARALRCDKLTLAALSGTLSVIGESGAGAMELPLWQLATASHAQLHERARQIAGAVEKQVSDAGIEIASTTSYVGGGAVPGHGLPSAALVVRRPGCSEVQLARVLRLPPGREQSVVGRLERSAVHLDLRAVFPHQDARLCSAIIAALLSEE